MNVKTFDYKVPGGKLLRIHAVFELDKILECKIFGDFFMHPEEAKEGLEAFLLGKTLAEINPELIDNYLLDNQIELYGFASKDLIYVLKQIYENL